jgi:hypothetical protein
MNYICEYKKSIPDILCNEIIEIFESQENKDEDNIINSLNKTIEKPSYFVIPKNEEKWKKIEMFLYKELASKLKKYINKNNTHHDNNIIFENNELYTPNFIIKKYEKQKGKNIYHNDEYSNNNNSRVITFIWYLNIIEEGGNTIFWENHKIQQELGKLILFPSFWCYPCKHEISLSDDKYIITGCVYEKNDK